MLSLRNSGFFFHKHWKAMNSTLIKRVILEKLQEEEYTSNCVQIDLGFRRGEENVLVVQTRDSYESELEAMEIDKKR